MSTFFKTTAAVPKNADFHENRYHSIQTLRGIAAIFVILEHIRFLNCGAFGVDIFFCISGFMIMLATHKDTCFFLRKRLIRILPLYYIMTLFTWTVLMLFPGLFEQTTPQPVFLIKSLLFIPFDIGGGVLQPLMRIGWTVNCEMFFYLLFFISFHISHRFRGLICGGLLGALIAFNYLLPVSFAPLSFYGNPIMLEFLLGILCYYAARGIYRLHSRGRLPGFLAPLGALAALLLFCVLLLTKENINILGFRRVFLWGIPGFMLVLCFFVFGLKWKMPAWSVRLGDMSYSIYLIHYYPVMFLDRMVFDFSVCSPYALAGAAVSVLICLLCSFVSWLLVEKRLTGFLKKIFLSC